MYLIHMFNSSFLDGSFQTELTEVDDSASEIQLLETWHKVANLRTRECQYKLYEEIFKEWPLYEHANLGVR